MSQTTKTTDLRADLRTAYLVTFDAFATGANEVATAINADSKQAIKLLRRLASAGLIDSLHVNDEKRLTWQCNETYDSISRSTAIRRFDKAFPKGVKSPFHFSKAVRKAHPKVEADRAREARS